MKNFEDILKTENTEEVIVVEDTSNNTDGVEKKEVSPEDALAKFKKHKSKKSKNNPNRKFVQTVAETNDVETLEPAIEVDETPLVVESSTPEEVPVEEVKQPTKIKVSPVVKEVEAEKIEVIEVVTDDKATPKGQLAFSINADALNLVEESDDETSTVETEPAPIENTNEVTEVVLEETSEETKKVSIQAVKVNPVQVVEETVEPTNEVVEPIVNGDTSNDTTEDNNQEVVEQNNSTNEIEVLDDNSSNEVVEEVSNNSTVEPVTEVPSNENVAEKTSKTKKVSSKTNKIKKVEYKTAIKLFVGAVAVAITVIAAIALYKGVNLVPVEIEDGKVAKIQPNNQVVVIESDDTILLKKSLNEELPVNYYKLLNSKQNLEVPSGFMLFENIYSNAVPNLVTVSEVNGREHYNTAVFSSFGIKSKDNTVLKNNEQLIKDVIAISLEGKDLKFFTNDTMIAETISFAVERVIGEEVEVKPLDVLHDFKK